MRSLFDELSETYDSTGIDFFGQIARALVRYARLRPGSTVLDVGFGAGAALAAASEAVGANGRVLGIGSWRASSRTRLPRRRRRGSKARPASTPSFVRTVRSRVDRGGHARGRLPIARVVPRLDVVDRLARDLAQHPAGAPAGRESRGRRGAPVASPRRWVTQARDGRQVLTGRDGATPFRRAPPAAASAAEAEAWSRPARPRRAGSPSRPRSPR